MWTQLNGVNTIVPFADLEVTAELPNGQCAMRFVRINNMWANPGNVNLIDVVTRPAEWGRIYLTATLFGQTVEVVLVNNEFVPPPVLSFDIFNNGEGGSPSRPNASLAQAGLIRMWTHLDGVGSLVPYDELTVTAVFPNGQCAMEFVRINNMWENPGNVNLIDINTRPAVWERIYLTAVLFDTTVEVILVNDEFEPPRTLTTTVYAEGWRDTINIRFFLDDELAELPLEDIVFIVDDVEVENIRDFTVNIADWQTSTSAVFINKQVAWQHIIVHISAYGQTVTHEFTNNMFVTGNPVAPLEDNGIVAVEVDGVVVVIENPRSVVQFVYVMADPVNHGRIIFGEATFDNATQQWVSVRIPPPSDVDVVIAQIRADVRAAAVLPDTRVSRDIPTFDSNLRRLPCRTRVFITLVLPELPIE
jgi:hypothetical protein